MSTFSGEDQFDCHWFEKNAEAITGTVIDAHYKKGAHDNVPAPEYFFLSQHLYTLVR
jgi:hypothetical protein